jgi:hypothetical protein
MLGVDQKKHRETDLSKFKFDPLTKAHVFLSPGGDGFGIGISGTYGNLPAHAFYFCRNPEEYSEVRLFSIELS